jgi:hypothetical protein
MFSKGVLALLRSPLENYHNILTVLALENYPALFEFLSPSDRRKACLEVVKVRRRRRKKKKKNVD